MRLKSGEEVEAAVKKLVFQPGKLIYLVQAIIALITALTILGKGDEAANVIPENIRGIFYED